MLLSPLNDASDDIVDGESSFQFSPEAEFTSPLYVHVNFATDNEAESLWCDTAAKVLKTFRNSFNAETYLKI